jgi:hypothetical protein
MITVSLFAIAVFYALFFYFVATVNKQAVHEHQVA